MKRIVLTVALAAFTYMSGIAIVAKPGPRLVEQPDGDTLTVRAFGDQHFHWLENEQGEWVEQGEDGYYRVVSSLNAEQIAAKREQSASYQGAQRAKARQEMQRIARPLNLAPRGLVILMNFADQSFTTPKDEMVEMINGDHYVRDYSYTYRTNTYYVHSEGSARQYFEDQSMGQYRPQFDVAGPYTASQNMRYYGSYNDSKAYQLIIEACKLADEDGFDFSQYDCDNDGEIDFVFVIYAGYGEADGGAEYTIWPHTYWIKDGNGQRVLLDGKYLNTYACGNEIDYLGKQHTGIGTFVHEFSHVLGLPDLYSTNNSNHKTMGEWDVMDAGPYNNSGNTPPAFSAYERFFCGWLVPGVLNHPATVSLEDLRTSNKAYIVTATGESNLVGNNPNPAKFYMLENRQQRGWDEWLPGHGLLITAVNYSYNTWEGNTVNNTSSKMGVDLVEADGRASAGSYGKAKDAFPAGATEFTPYSNYPITDIRESDGRIIFNFMGGADWISSVATEEATETDKKGREYTAVYAVYDISGRLLYITDAGKQFYSEWQKKNVATIDNLSQLAPGTYVIMVSDEGAGKANHRRGVKVTIR